LFYQEPNHEIYCGHSLTVLQGFPAESVDMVMTSPPYWSLRTYKTEPIIWGDNHCKHEWGRELIKAQAHGAGKTNPGKETWSKDRDAWSNKQGQFCSICGAWKGELGLEPTIELYISHLIQIFNEAKRVLKKTGSCWVNLGDSYSGGKGQSDCGDSEYQENRTDANLQKPYHQMGGHGLTRPADGKIGVIAKSLCAIPERFVLAMMEQGWIYRQDIIWYKNNPMPESVKDRFTDTWEHLYFFVKSRRYYFEQQFEKSQWYDIDNRADGTKHLSAGKCESGEYGINGVAYRYDGNRNKRNLWTINTQPCASAHFAVYPEKLCETPILACCPIDGTVLDPFNGRGTTQIVAKKLGRKSIGIDLNPDYCKLAEKELQKITIPLGLNI